MPVSEGPQLNLPRTILFAVGSVLLGVLLLLLIVWLAGSGDVQFKLGDDVFEVGDAERFAERIEEGVDGQRAPIPFPSLSRNRPIFVQHIGDDPLTGWFAIDARSPTQPEDCALAWDPDGEVFVDQCDASSTFPPDGAGLLQYDISVNDDGRLVVDLNQDEDAPES